MGTIYRGDHMGTELYMERPALRDTLLIGHPITAQPAQRSKSTKAAASKQAPTQPASGSQTKAEHTAKHHEAQSTKSARARAPPQPADSAGNSSSKRNAQPPPARNTPPSTAQSTQKKPQQTGHLQADLTADRPPLHSTASAQPAARKVTTDSPPPNALPFPLSQGAPP